MQNDIITIEHNDIAIITRVINDDVFECRVVECARDMFKRRLTHRRIDDVVIASRRAIARANNIAMRNA